MSYMDSITSLSTSLINGLVEFSGSVVIFVQTVLDLNHKIMSVVIQVGANFVHTVWAALSFIYVCLNTILTCLFDFFAEFAHFLSALFQLIWKILILVWSFLNLLFRSLECVGYFLWTGGKWTAETVTISGQNLTDNGLSTWKYFVVSLKEFTASVIGGLITLGGFFKSIAVLFVDALFLGYDYARELVLYTDFHVRYACRYVAGAVYYFFTDYLLNLPKEAFLGCLMCIASAMVLKNVINHLCSEGLTFPMYSWINNRFRVEDYDSDFGDYENDRGEFSDDDDVVNYSFDNTSNYDDINDEYSINSDNSDSYDDDSSSNDELEVDSDSDNESIAASESEIGDINIQLPDLNNSGLNNSRRSTTPSRTTREMSADDLQKVIETEKEKRMCVVCHDRSKSVLILPCRHMCLCLECGNHIARSRSRAQRKCPLCRTQINTIMNVYL